MKIDTLGLLQCPECEGVALDLSAFERKGDEIVEGVLRCGGCRSWYRIEGGIADLTPPALRRRAPTVAFADRYGLPNVARGPSDAADHDGHFERYIDEYERRVVNSPYHRIHDSARFLPWVERTLRTGDLVLDVGCGTGRQSVQLAERGIRPIGIDESEAMVRRAREKLVALGLASSSEFVVGTAERLPFRNETFAACVIHGTLHHVDDPERTLHEAALRLRPLGKLYLVDNHASPLRFLFDILMRALPLYSEEAHADALFTAPQLVRWLDDAGVRSHAELSTYLPPHLWYLVRGSVGRILLVASDAILGRAPLIRRVAGIVVVQGERSGVARIH